MYVLTLVALHNLYNNKNRTKIKTPWKKIWNNYTIFFFFLLLQYLITSLKSKKQKSELQIERKKIAGLRLFLHRTQRNKKNFLIPKERTKITQFENFILRHVWEELCFENEKYKIKE